jgi:hypothetical protein
VSVAERRATVLFDPVQTSPAKLVAVLTALGYEATPASGQT